MQLSLLGRVLFRGHLPKKICSPARVHGQIICHKKICHRKFARVYGASDCVKGHVYAAFVCREYSSIICLLENTLLLFFVWFFDLSHDQSKFIEILSHHFYNCTVWLRRGLFRTLCDCLARGGLLNKVLYGEAPPGGSKPLPFHILIFTKMVPLSYT